ncbi:MAG TPA: Imm30 family immunity protein [Bacillales bacterium]|nr:Imm30 family immunity protein [Bacillales bacterium]
MDINNQTRILIDNRFLRTQYEIQQFEQAIVSILDMNEVDHIKNLCQGFDDATERDEVMFGLIHAIESYNKTFGSEKPLIKLAESLPNMLPQAKEWGKTLHKRILNHDLSRRVYAEVISNVDARIKNIVLQLVNEIKDKNPKKFENLVSEFLSNLK